MVFDCITSVVDWWLIGDHCYHFNPNVRMQWSEAKTYCNDINANLLALETEEEFNKIKTLVNSSYGETTHELSIIARNTTNITDFFLSLPEYLHPVHIIEHPNHMGYHLHLQGRNSSGPWLWGDGSTLGYDAWKIGQPNSPATDLTAILQLPNLEFNDFKDKLSSVACEKLLG